MSARDDIDFSMETAFGIEPHETAAFLDTYRDEVLREAAEKIRQEIEEFLTGGRFGGDPKSPWVGGLQTADDLIDPDIT